MFDPINIIGFIMTVIAWAWMGWAMWTRPDARAAEAAQPRLDPAEAALAADIADFMADRITSLTLILRAEGIEERPQSNIGYARRRTELARAMSGHARPTLPVALAAEKARNAQIMAAMQRQKNLVAQYESAALNARVSAAVNSEQEAHDRLAKALAHPTRSGTLHS